jgi:branched-chain amino acid aminotransferase
VKLDGRQIGSGKPGSITQRILDSFRRRVLTEGTRL